MYQIVEAEVRDGYIFPYEPEKIPKSGMVLVLVLPEERKKADPEEIRNLLGWLKTDTDAVQWQKSIRNEWDHP